MERGRIRGDKYWVDALKIRRSNWGLIPAPLPFGSAIGKGADKTSKDFLISFGLEECMSSLRLSCSNHLLTIFKAPAQTRKRAVGRMSSYETDSRSLIFPHRQRTRLRVSLRCLDSNGSWALSYNTIVSADDGTLEGSLRAAQQEMVEQEIFTVLIREAGNLPTASSRVSERLIVIDAAQGTELRFELVRRREHIFTIWLITGLRLTKRTPCRCRQGTKPMLPNVTLLPPFSTCSFCACTHIPRRIGLVPQESCAYKFKVNHREFYRVRHCCSLSSTCCNMRCSASVFMPRSTKL